MKRSKWINTHISFGFSVRLSASGTHPAASLYPLVHMIREGFTVDVAPAALHGVKAALLQHDLALADHHHRTSAHFSALKDVILYSLIYEKRSDTDTINAERAHSVIDINYASLHLNTFLMTDLFDITGFHWATLEMNV